MLTIAFQQRFDEVSDFLCNIYLASLISASLATACITAPVAFHRIVFRRGMKDDLMNTATRYVAAGMTFLALAMVGAVFLVLDYLLSLGIAVVVAGGLAAVFLVLWVVVPYVARARGKTTSKTRLDRGTRRQVERRTSQRVVGQFETRLQPPM